MRNVGLKASTGDFIWFVDDDVSLDPNSIEQLMLLLKDIRDTGKIGAISGRIVEPPSFDVRRLSRPIYLSLFRGAVGWFNYDTFSFPKDKFQLVKGTSGTLYPIVPFVQGTSMVFRKCYLDEIGGFDEDLGVGYASFEDSEPCFAMHRKGWLTIFCGDFVLTHHKLPRIGGNGRGYDDYQYSSYLVRNYCISLLKNKYPSFTLALTYFSVFCVVHVVRVAYYNLKNRHIINSVAILWSSLICVLNGVKMGVSAGREAKWKRLNSAV